MSSRPAARFGQRAALVAIACTMLSACAAAERVGDLWPFNDDEEDVDPNAPDRARRIPVLAAEQTLSFDPETAAPVVIPGEYVNASWPQTGGAPTHAMQHPAVGSMARVWRRDIGAGDERDSRITAQPVIEAGRIFVMDGKGEIAAYDAETGQPEWRQRLRVEGRRDSYGFGGGLAVAGGRVIVTSGIGLIVALDVADGSEIWRIDTVIPMHSAPTVVNGQVFAVTDDNVLISVDAASGDVQWRFQGITEPARVMTSPAPAVLGDIVVAPFGSGEVVAMQSSSGRPIWQDALTRAGRLAPISTLNDVAGSPVVYDGAVYAMSHSGLLAAISLESGERLWDLPMGGVNMPWLAGDTLFVVSADGELAAVDRASGELRWLTLLPGFKNIEKRKNKIAWAGPVLAGGRLIVVSSEGEGRLYDPATGNQIGEFEPGDTYVPPVVANRTLYVLNSDGQLSAYR